MSCGWLSMIGYVAELQERHATQHFRFGHRRFGNEFGFLSSSAFPPRFRVKQPDGVGSGALT